MCNTSAGFWRRLFAIALDFLFLVVVIAYPASGWFPFFASNPGWTLLIGFALSFFYFIILNSRIGNGQTLGKRMLGIRVVDIYGETISVGKSGLRFLVLATPFFAGKVQIECYGAACALTTVVSWLLALWSAVIVYLFVFNRRTGQSLHDLAARTYVVQTALWPARKSQPSLAEDGSVSTVVSRLCVTTQGIWLGHWKIIMAGFTACVVLVVALWPTIQRKTPLSGMMQIREAVL
jgi:uncharacterized RDD family membrane protein YckC